jgi:zinc transport system substrate-binding protein
MSRISSFRHRSRREASERRFVSVFFALSVLAPLACRPEPDQRDGQLPVVAVSILPLAGIVDRLLPFDAAQVTVLVPPGMSPHSFEPGIGQLTEIEGADLVIELGHPAFAWEATWLDGLLAGTEAPRVRLAEVCDIEADDPHIWLDPDCLRRMTGRTAAALAGLLPEQRHEIETLRAAFETAIDSVDLTVSEGLSGSGRRSFLVQHPAWGYFARAYGLEQLSILSHGSGDRGSVRLARVMEAAKAEGIRTVIVQPQANHEAARMVAREIGARVEQVDPLARDPLDAFAAMAEALLREPAE